ncbi:DUF5954 family protein [Streptomyces sp. NPDC003077]|uniref:DUF5954 family protein n=1 Tax=Streptomyces sp. NPDC003077 TaxID=3154443 RepID=UPI0033B560E9
MEHDGTHIPDHRVIKVTRQDSPVADLADMETWEARERYPELRVRGPLFAVGQRRDDGRWQIMIMEEGNPQEARDALNAHFRQRAQDTRDELDRAAYLAAAERLDWEPLDELTVLGRDHRVIRGDLFLRFGPEGPEPPRPADPDPDPVAVAGRRTVRHAAEGFVIDPAAATGLAEGIVKTELLTYAYSSLVVPADVYADSVRARETHPGVVLLPAGFTVAERKPEGEWGSICGSCATPREARELLSAYLREFAPRLLRLDEEDWAEYARAADHLDGTRANEVAVAGRRFRVVRVQGLVRVGPDGPELPRASDWVPHPPPALHEKQLQEEERREREAAGAAGPLEADGEPALVADGGPSAVGVSAEPPLTADEPPVVAAESPAVAADSPVVAAAEPVTVAGDEPPVAGVDAE